MKRPVYDQFWQQFIDFFTSLRPARQPSNFIAFVSLNPFRKKQNVSVLSPHLNVIYDFALPLINHKLGMLPRWMACMLSKGFTLN